MPDPYFGGAGPERTGCIECGNCMIGCRDGAKNRLDLNYLYLAERAGAVIHPETEVTAIRPDGDGWQVVTRRRTFRCGQVMLAAGALGTQRLLHAMKDTGVLPRLSDRLGALTRTNSEALLGAQARAVEGVVFSRVSRSRRRSTRTPTRTSSRCATARAATRWACSPRCWWTAAAGCRDS